MATLSDEQLRALRFIARHPGGCTEATLLKQGFTAVQLGQLVFTGLAIGVQKAPPRRGQVVRALHQP
jgi:hypothetical protein